MAAHKPPLQKRTALRIALKKICFAVPARVAAGPVYG